MLLLFCRSWCPDRVMAQALKYISQSMGKKFAEGVILNVEEMWMESKTTIPMVCFLAMGSDPTNTIDNLSRKHNLRKLNFEGRWLSHSFSNKKWHKSNAWILY